MRSLLFFSAFFYSFLVFGQGPELLRQQYSKADYDLEYYRKWNVDVFVQPHLSNTTNRDTKARLHLDVGGNVHYRFTKSFGLSSGIHYNRLSYSYTSENDTSIDRLRFLRFPFVLSGHPIKRLRITLGLAYHWLLEASGQPPPLNERSTYPKGIFLNSLGLQSSVEYTIWKRFSVSFGYRFQKRSANPIQRETQNFNGLTLGVHYSLLNPNRATK